MNEITNVALRQASEVVKINENIEHVSNSTNSSSAMSVEFAETSKGFETQSKTLKHVVDRFKLRS
jgi:methyl-accepting chemotaxis protein